MKAILITNIPKDCTFCPCHTYMSNYTDLNGKKQRSMCKELGKLFNVGKGRPSWCPLRPIPDKAAEDLSKGLDAMEKMKSVKVRKIIRTE